MGEAKHTRILGMAMVRGLLDAELLREVMAEDRDPIQALVAMGVLDAEDLAILEGLLAHSEAASPLSAGPTQGQVGLVSGEAPEALQALWQGYAEPGDVSGRRVLKALTLPAWRQYRDLRFLGEGGMGRIFKAFDPSLKRMVALKFLRREDPDLVSRFVAEAQAQAKVEHPNVCRVYEVGEWNGQSYIAMELLKGETLEVAAPSLTVEEKVTLIEQVAEAVHAAHHQGLIHRDLKPANIMVERLEDGRVRPMVLDFGLARGLEPSGQTVAGLLVGTTLYMAPEQARGDHAHISRRTDVYALGATLYRALAGQAPFGGSAGLDVVRRVQEEEAPSLRRRVPELPRDLETVVMKCLAREPERRYETALALAEDLRRFREGEPILARRPTLAYRATTWAKRNRLVMAVGAAGVAGLLVLGSLALVARMHAATRARHAQHFGQEAERIEALLRYAFLQPAHDVRPELAQARSRLAALREAARRAGSLAEDPADYAEGRALLALGEPESAMPRLRRAWDAGFHSPDLALALGRCASALYQLERERAQRIGAPELREARLKALERERLGPALAWLSQGRAAALESPAFFEAQLLRHQGRLDEALALARKAQSEAPWLFEARLLEGELHLDRGATAHTQTGLRRCASEALEAFRQAARLAQSSPAARLGEARSLRALLEAEAWGPEADTLLKEAFQALRAGLALEPSHRALRRLEAELLLDEGERSARRGAAEPEPAFRRAQGLLEALQSESPDELPVLEALADLHSRRVANLTLDATAYLGAADTAIRWMQKALALDPASAHLHERLSVLHVRRLARISRLGQAPWADFEASLLALRRAMALQPGSSTLENAAAMVWLERAEYERTHGLDPRPALAWVRRLARADAGPRLVRYTGLTALANAALIQIQAEAARDQAASASLEACRRATSALEQADPDKPLPDRVLAEALLAVAQARLDEGQDAGTLLDEASRRLARAGRRDASNYTQAFLELRGALLEGRAGRPGAFERALRKGQALVRQEPGEALAYGELAQLAWWRGRELQAGLRASARALALHPGWPEAMLWRGLLLRRAGQIQASRACLREAVARDALLRRRLERLSPRG